MRINELIDNSTDPKDLKYYSQLAKTYGLSYGEKTMSNFKFMGKIKRDCQPYLKQAGNMVFRNGLWRGLGLDNPSARMTKTARLGDRIPRDMDQGLHEKLNVFFNNTYGHPYRNGVFVTGDADEASQYGQLYQIFPIGNFDYLWSPDIPDLMGALSTYNHYNEDFNEWMSENLTTYRGNDLQHAARMNTEIMLWTKQYYALSAGAIMGDSQKDAYLNILR